MPQLPVFTATEAPDPAALPRGVPQIDIGQAGRVADAVARGSAQLEETVRPWAERMAESQRALQASDAMVGAQQKLGAMAQAAARKAGTLDANGNLVGTDQVTNEFADEAQQLRAATLAQVQDPLVKQMLAQHLDEATIGAAHDVRSQGFTLEAAARNGKLSLDINDLSHQYAQAGSPEQRQQVLTTAATAINTLQHAGYITGEQAAQHLITFRQKADAADAYRDIATDPAGAMKKLQNPAFYPNMDEYTRGMLMYRADGRAQEATARAMGAVRSAYDDNLASIAATGLPVSQMSEDQIRAAFPGDADRRLDALKLASDSYRATKAMSLTSVAQDDATIQAFKPSGTGFADQERAQRAVISAAQAKWKAIGSDPAGYVLNAAPDIKASFDAAAQDQTKLPQALAQLDAAYDKMGVPASERRVMPEGQAQATATDLMAKPEDAPQKLTQLQQAYGSAWPRAFQDLVQVGKLPAPYQAVATLANPRDGALLARFLGELPNGKTAGDLVGAKEEQDIRNSVRSDPSVQGYVQSLTRQGASAQQADGILNAIDDLAFAKSFYDRDPKAALSAIDAFTGRYDFSLPGGPRVPADQASQAADNARLALLRLSDKTVSVPPSFSGKEGAPSADDYLRTLKSAPSWITAPQGNALWLMDPAGRVVRQRDGTPYEVGFGAPPPEDQAEAARAALAGAPAMGPVP